MIEETQRIPLEDRFFKVPVDKLAARLMDPINHGETIAFNKSQQGMVNGLEESRFWVHISARRTGKSFSAAILALAKLLEPKQNVMVVAPNYNLSSIIWDYVSQFIKELRIETDKWNQKDKVITLVNGSVFRLLSATNRDSLIGRAANLLIIDEAAIIPDDQYFRRELRPSLSTDPNSRALFISTPRGKANYLYEYYMRGQNEEQGEFDEWGSGLYDWTSNPLLSEKDIEEARSTISNQEFMQEYYCVWATFEGQIYALDEEKHLMDLQGIEEFTFETIAGLDIGYRDATAFVVIKTDGEKYYVVDEYISKEEVTSAHAAVIQEKINDWDIDNIYIDSAAQQARADLAYEYDIYCDNANKSVNDGIRFLQNLIEKDLIEFDIGGAGNAFRHLSAYRWNMKTDSQKPVHDEHSHAADALRYAIYSHQQNTVGLHILH